MAEVTERSKGVPQKRFRPYPEYKDSGVEYLGQVPPHWAVYPLRRRLFREAGSIRIGPFGSALKLEFMVPEGFKVYGQEHVIARDFGRGSKYVDETKFTELAGCEIQSRDLLITMMGSSGRCAVVPDGIETGIMDSHLLRIRLPDGDLDPEFVALLIDEAGYVRDQIQEAGKGAIMHGLNSSIIKAVVIAVPPIAEQRRILDFVDRETAKIDALVARKKRLIELLQEKRTALITRAVTRGLDPNVPMKDSGIEWLGEVPAHWEVKKLGYLTSIGNGSTPNRGETRYWTDGLHPWLTSTKINEGVIVAADEFVTQAALRECHLPRAPAGSILVAITGEGQTRGRTAILSIDSTISQHLAYVTPSRPGVTAGFLVRLFEARYEWLREESSGSGSTRAALTCEFLRSIRLAFPPPSEQQAIATMLDRETARIAALIAKVRQAIGQLREFRTALISATVTGKIDVRGAEL